MTRGAEAKSQNAFSFMSDSQLTTITRLDERMSALKERL